MDKKGLSKPMEMVIGLVLVLAAFFIVLGFLVRYGVILGDDSDLQLCRATLEIQSKTKVLGVDSPLSINCPKRTVNIGENRMSVEKKGPDTPVTYFVPQTVQGKAVAVPKITYKTPEERTLAVQSYFAESMRRCWYMGLEGKKELFNDQSILSEKNVCIICDEIRVDLPDEQKEIDTNLQTYLATTPLPTNKEKTYDEYLFTPTELQKGWVEKAAGWVDGKACTVATIATGGIAAIPCMWVWAKNNEGPETLSAGTICLEMNAIERNPKITDGTYATVFIRYFSKTDYGCMNTYVVPQTKLRTLCDYAAN